MNLLRHIRFYIGLWGIKAFFPYFMYHSDNPGGEDSKVDAIIFASSEKILDLYATRRDWRESQK